MLANIHLNPGIKLDPELAVVVEKLALKHPMWVFESKAKIGGRSYENDESFHRPISGGMVLPDDVRYTRTVTVLQDGLNAGAIGVFQNYSRRAAQNWHYVVRSQRIDNGRKGNAVSTRNAALAVSTANRYFLAPSLPEMLYAAITGAVVSFEETLRDLSRPIERAQYALPPVDMQIVVYNLLKGIPFDERAVRETFESERFEKALANYELAGRMRIKRMRGVMMFRGHYVYLNRGYTETVTGKPSDSPFDKDEVLRGDVKACAFEELPQAWQDKLAVLQLMQDTELVLDVGYRLDESTFLIAED